jgi:hypothetical protein
LLVRRAANGFEYFDLDNLSLRNLHNAVCPPASSETRVHLHLITKKGKRRHAAGGTMNRQFGSHGQLSTA